MKINFSLRLNFGVTPLSSKTSERTLFLGELFQVGMKWTLFLGGHFKGVGSGHSCGSFTGL